MNRLLFRVNNRLARLVSPLISAFERKSINDLSSLDNNLQPIFIIGAPRTGSTILYQALTNHLNVGYIDNVMARWFKNPLFGAWLSSRFFKYTAHNNFLANHGDTSVYGGRAPSECGALWYRWLPKDRDFVDIDDFSNESALEFRREIKAVMAFMERPLLFKNLNAGQRLRFIKAAFPQAKFIWVRRDNEYVVNSLLNARNKVGIGEGQWWSVKPPDYKNMLQLPPMEMCLAQIIEIEKQIALDLKLFPEENVLEVHYNEFDDSLINLIGSWIGTDIRNGGAIPAFKKDSSESLKQEFKLKFKQIRHSPVVEANNEI